MNECTVLNCPSDTRFEIRALAVWGRARHFSFNEPLQNTKYMDGEEIPSNQNGDDM